MLEHDFVNYPELTASQLEQFQFSSPHVQIVSDFDATIVKVHDGDTVTLRTDFRDFDFPLRLLDVDAPELSEGGKEAGDYLRSRVLGRIVKVLVDPFNRVGKYGRLLGKVVADGLVVSDEMLSLGLVKPFGKKQEGEVPLASKYFNYKQWF